MADDGMPDQPGPRRQTEIYMEGMADIRPSLPIDHEDLAAAAREALPEEAWAYVAGGAGRGETISENSRAFERWRLLPRMFQGVGERDLAVEVAGQTLPYPVALAPIGVLSIVHERGDLAMAEAAAEVGLPFVVSSASGETMEDIAEAAPETPKWFQLYWSTDRDITASFVDRAAEAGYDALVVTVDTPMLAWRERDLEQAYLPFLEGKGIANYLSDPAFRERLDQPPEDNEFAAIREFVEIFGDPGLTWDDLSWLADRTDLPIVVKGVLHPEDARAAVDAGADAVVVSNHGGRQVDTAVGALEMLPAVVDAVGEDADVLFDSGIRRGADVLTALALGAEAVLFGRPYVYGLALEGASGVEAVCENLLADLDLTMGLCGQTAVSDLDRSLLVRRPEADHDH